MVVYDLNLFRAGRRPTENDAILLIDTDAVESFAISFERLEAIRRGNTQ